MIDTLHTFDDWPVKYDQWFETPIGKLIYRIEGELIRGMFQPKPGDRILDAGCGTGVFTRELLIGSNVVVGLELSFPMLLKAKEKLGTTSFDPLQGDMRVLPFGDNQFNRTISVTALEFIEEAKKAVDELFRVTKPGGCILAATLNSLSPWAKQRKAAGRAGHPIFKHVFFRSPDDMRALSATEPAIKTAVHFPKEEDPASALLIEKQGQAQHLETGAFLAACWKKPS
jgi:ubiquinone/menaquinone biosynthesis C-methylase UbiE